jgi:hypothetical protein
MSARTDVIANKIPSFKNQAEKKRSNLGVPISFP